MQSSGIHQCLKNWGCTIVVYDRDENACEQKQKKQERRSAEVNISA